MFKFADLFSGIGGFHIALKELGGECVFACDTDKEAVKTYESNFNIKVQGDIQDINVKDIHKHDFLVAGFPCQPFSKGGYRRGFKDKRGRLFFEILRIVDYHKPKYMLLENVPNLATHNNGKTFAFMKQELESSGYITTAKPLILSPNDFGMPVLRKRLYIVCVRKDLCDEVVLDLNLSSSKQDIYSLVERNKQQRDCYISEYETKVLAMWNDFYKNIHIDIIGFPIYAMELRGNEPIEHLPSWKQTHIIKNRDLYKKNKVYIDKWFIKYDNLNWLQPTHKKFEWQAGTDCKDIYECLIQFRPSGIRAKRPDCFSTLVAMNHPQIIGRYKRRLSLLETKRLQAIPDDYLLHENRNIALKQLGNAVNVKVVKEIALAMLRY